MAAFNFPASPSNGDTYTLNSVTYQYDGTKWVRYSAAVGAQGSTGPTGPTGAQGAQGHQGLQGAQAHISTSAPSSGVNNGDLWWESDTGDLAIYYNDGSSSQWIDINTGPRGAQGATGPTGAQGAAGAQGNSGSATITNESNNRVLTATSTSGTINGEGNLTFDGSTLTATAFVESIGNSGRGGKFGNLMIGYSPYNNTVQNLGDGSNLHLQYNVNGNVLVNEGGGYMQARNIIPETGGTYELGASDKRWKRLHIGNGGEVRFGDTTNTNFIGITEGLVNTFTDQDFMSIYFRNSMRFFSNNNNERVRIHSDGDLQLYNGNIVGNSSHTMEIGDITNGAVKRIRMCQGGEVHFGDTTTSNFMGITEGTVNQFSDVDNIGIYYRNALKFFSNNNVERLAMESGGHFRPSSNNVCDLGTTALRWRNIYTNDLQLSNEGNANEVDGTWGQYTIQEGEHDLFLINRRSGKRYKFNLTEVN